MVEMCRRQRVARARVPATAIDQALDLIAFSCSLLALDPSAASASLSCPTSSPEEAEAVATRAPRVAASRGAAATVTVTGKRVRVLLARAPAVGVLANG